MTEDSKFLQLSDPFERSTNFIDVVGAVSRDFDGLLTCTVLYNGLPVAYVTHPQSNYGDADPDHGHPGSKQVVMEDDPAQQQVYAHFMVWIGEAVEDFPAKVAEVQDRVIDPDDAKARPRGVWAAYDEFEHMLGDGHAWLAFVDDVDCEMYSHFPNEWPLPKEWDNREVAG